MSNLIGHSLGRYHVLEQLGEGGMAIVYKAYDTRLEREVAIKIIRTERLTIENTPKALKRFERESKSLGKLNHPNIVPISDHGEYEGKPYLVMPYFPGGTLKSKLSDKPVPWRDALRILIPIADALGYAHRHDIIHRDVKPANILITEDGQPMLADFGVAKILDIEETMELTGTGVGIGTPEYMAPEQTSNKPVDARADIYAFGVVFYEMVTGRKPYVADTPMAVLIMHSRDPLPRPRSFTPGLPQAVENVIIKALAKRPEDRYQSMAEFAKALDAIAGQQHAAPAAAISKRQTMSVLVGLLAVALIGAGIYFTSTGAFKTSSPLPTSSLQALPKSTQTQQQEPLVRPTDTPEAGSSDGLIIQDCDLGMCAFNGIHVISASGISMKEFKIPEFAGKFIQYPFWSPDGTKIIFGISPHEDPSHTSENKEELLYMLDVLTEKLTQLTNIPENNVSPVSPPVGRKIAFHWNCDVWMMNPDGSDLKKHFTHGDQCATKLRWSPDDQWLAWISPGNPDTGDGRGGAKYISIYNPSEKKIFSIPLDFNKDAQYNDAWSPDGSALYFFIETSGNRQVYKLDAACLQTGCSKENITPVDFAIPQSWFPNYYPQWDRNPQSKTSTPIATSYASDQEQARAFAAPILTAIINRPPDFSDDFSLAATNWQWGVNTDVGIESVGEKVWIKGEVIDGRLVVTKSQMGFGSGGPPAQLLTNFVAQVDVAFIDAPIYDIGFNWYQRSDHYRLQIEEGNRWKVVCYCQPENATLTGGNIAPGVIKGQGVANALVLIAYGQRYAFYLNDVPLGYVADDTLSGGAIGFTVGRSGYQNITIAFDNFKIWNLDSVPGLPPIP